MDASHKYAYRIAFSPEDNAWIGTCDKFPSLSHLDATGILAYCGITRLVRQAEKEMSPMSQYESYQPDYAQPTLEDFTYGSKVVMNAVMSGLVSDARLKNLYEGYEAHRRRIGSHGWDSDEHAINALFNLVTHFYNKRMERWHA